MFRSDACACLMCVVKYACSSIIFLSVIKLTRKLTNNLTLSWHCHPRILTRNRFHLGLPISLPICSLLLRRLFTLGIDTYQLIKRS
jgi:hypothetical protein